MKKKFFSGLALLAMLATPPTFTSCDDDDVNAIISIIDAILSANDLTGTAWITYDNTFALSFDSATQGYYFYQSSDGILFNYTVDTTNNILSLEFSDQTLKYSIVEFEKDVKLVLKDASNNTITMKPYVDEGEG